MSAQKHSSSYTAHNKVQLVKGGSTFFDLLDTLIAGAKKSIHIRVYIWNDDIKKKKIAERLMEATRRNVSVYVVADGYASGGLSGEFVRELKNNGVHFRYFEPLWRCSHFYFGRRLHEKVVVIDEVKVLIGGINFADRYNDLGTVPAWLDYALYAEGEAAYKAYGYCYNQWYNKTTMAILPDFRSYFRDHCSVKVLFNDWVKGKMQVWKTYFDLFNRAEESITIMCSYFLPGRVLRKRLGLAAKRGVKVRLILAGPCDVMLAKYAERYLYRWMLRNKIEIYEYQPAVLHAKMMVVDGHWVTIGSYNVNNVSAYASTEINFQVRNKPFARHVHSIMERITHEDCIEVSQKSPAFKVNFFKKFVQKSSYELVRIILNLSTFYFKQE